MEPSEWSVVVILEKCFPRVLYRNIIYRHPSGPMSVVDRMPRAVCGSWQEPGKSPLLPPTLLVGMCCPRLLHAVAASRVSRPIVVSWKQR